MKYIYYGLLCVLSGWLAYVATVDYYRQQEIVAAGSRVSCEILEVHYSKNASIKVRHRNKIYNFGIKRTTSNRYLEGERAMFYYDAAADIIF